MLCSAFSPPQSQFDWHNAVKVQAIAERRTGPLHRRSSVPYIRLREGYLSLRSTTCAPRERWNVAPPGGYLDVSSVWAAMGAIANCGWSRYTALTVQAEELLRMNETINGEKTASEPQDRVTELIDQQAAISQVLRAIANSPHDLQPIFDAILDSATRLCRADIGSLRLSEESGLRRVAMRGDPLLVSQPAFSEEGSLPSQIATSRLPTHIPDVTAFEGDHRDDLWITAVNAGLRTCLIVPLL